MRLHWTFGLRLMRPCRGALILALVGCDCSSMAEFDHSARPGGDAPAVLPSGAAPPVAGCAPPVLVPTGSAWIGDFVMDAQGTILGPAPCETYWGARRFTVRRVFVDPDEVTNECYSHCVDAGACELPLRIDDPPDVPAWDDESMGRSPAVLDFARARAFCAWRGGRLPAVAELARASHGDLEDFCKPELRQAWLNCYFAHALEESPCAEFLAHALGWTWPPDQRVRSYPEDLGPFGHYDLFGWQLEYTGSSVFASKLDVAEYCALPDGAPAPAKLGSSDTPFLFGPGNRLVNHTPDLGACRRKN
ncbi:MAG: SUMF1/EgtB/PvdO family nonheme iron enzyme [Deltaproteobacteria bacterium]|nr:SUMF1/EgtB/PvdO family nonheme iron enzyme [Deltaproteobacteria bacterium]